MYIYDVSLQVLPLDHEESHYSAEFSFCRQHVGGMGYPSFRKWIVPLCTDSHLRPEHLP